MGVLGGFVTKRVKRIKLEIVAKLFCEKGGELTGVVDKIKSE
jgi:hypothetical protein